MPIGARSARMGDSQAHIDAEIGPILRSVAS
jgi:hypothetical protein